MSTRLRRLILDDYRPSEIGLAAYRITWSVLTLLILLPDFRAVADLPGSLFDPPFGPMQLVPAIPSRSVLALLTVVVGVAVVAILIGWHTTAASWTAAIAWTVGAGLAFSFGKIDHNLVVVWVAPAAAAAGWGRRWSVDEQRGRSGPLRAWPVALFAWCLALMMLSAALPKFRTGYLSPDTQVIQGVMFRQYHVHGRTELLASAALDLRIRAIWEAVDWTIVLLEAAFVVAWFSPRLLRLACALAVLFHLGVLLTANIAFTGNVMAYGLFFTVLAPRANDWRPPKVLVAVAGMTGLLLVFWQQLLDGPPLVHGLANLTDLAGVIISVVVIGAASIGALGYLAFSAPWTRPRRPRAQPKT